MKVAIIQFPGSNCDWDAEHAVHDVLGIPAKRIWHKSRLPSETEAVIVPGGFSFGDYLRCGAIARFSPIMSDLKEFAEKGGQVLGICNGFQILCEAGLLPGALVRNDCMEFRCINQPLRVEDSNDRFNRENLGPTLSLPIAHGEGNYRADDAALSDLEANGQVLLRYEGNPNGSVNDIAGIRNPSGNVYGMMPHPERAVESHHPTQDGLPVLAAFFEPIRKTQSVELSPS
jgi:phosphoribosylformylglycinamidine synthase subunit PurQ / glutaminase